MLHTRLMAATFGPALASAFALIGSKSADDDPVPDVVIASLNVGGDGPQPEYLGGTWQQSYGHVEEAFGAKIIFLSNPESEPCLLEEKYVERYKAAFRAYCTMPCLQKQERTDTPVMTPLGKKLREAPVLDYVVEKTTSLAGVKEERKEDWKALIPTTMTMPAFARYLMGTDIPSGFKKLPDLDKDPECKNRLVFPFFSGGFFKMYGMLYRGDEGHPYTEYWQSMIHRAKKCQYVQKVTQGPKEKGGAEPAYFDTNEYLPLMVFDLLVLRTFHEELSRRLFKTTKPVEYLMGAPLKKRKQEIVAGILKTVNILFLQEADDVLSAGKDLAAGLYGKGIAQYAPPNTKGVIDPAILMSGVRFAEPVKVAVLASARSAGQGVMQADGLEYSGTSAAAMEALQTDWVAFVAERKKGSLAVGEASLTVGEPVTQSSTITIRESDVAYYPGGDKFRPEWDKVGQKFKEDVLDVSATAVAVAALGGKKVLLMSMHPKSNGRPCVLFAYMAKLFFEARKETYGLHFMLLGLDANVLTREDKDEKKGMPDKNGFTWHEFKQATELLEFGVIFDPAKRTVWKQRTFLQTQLNKAAKVDKTIKDMMLQYPKTSLSMQSIEVVNVETKKPSAPWWHVHEYVAHFASRLRIASSVFDPNFGYFGESPYPMLNWPLDHFMTVAMHSKREPKPTIAGRATPVNTTKDHGHSADLEHVEDNKIPDDGNYLTT